MKKASKTERNEEIELIEFLDTLNEETKDLALNLALYLAKAKADSSSEKLSQLEPVFMKLVNGTVKVVQELSIILNAARNQETMVYQVPSGNIPKDRMERKLEEIVTQCNQILSTLHSATDYIA